MQDNSAKERIIDIIDYEDNSYRYIDNESFDFIPSLEQIICA